jgi:hypothetical protein
MRLDTRLSASRSDLLQQRFRACGIDGRNKIITILNLARDIARPVKPTTLLSSPTH